MIRTVAIAVCACHLLGAGLATGFSEISTVPLDEPYEVEIVGSLAFVTSQDSLTTIDITNRERPRVLSDLPLPGNPRFVEILDQVAYVGARDGGLRIIDVSDPTEPFEIGSIDDVYFEDLEILRGRHHMGWLVIGAAGDFSAGDFFGTIVYRIGLEPTELREFMRIGYGPSQNLEVSDRRVILFGNTGYGKDPVLDFSVDGSITLSDRVVWGHPCHDYGTISLGARDGEIIGGIAYYAMGSGFSTFDVSDPERPPRQLSCLQAHLPSDEDYHFEDVEVTGGFAFLAWSERGLIVMDVADPRNPKEVAFLDYSNLDVWLSDLEVVGSFAYLVDANFGLRIIDVGDFVTSCSLGAELVFVLPLLIALRSRMESRPALRAM